MNQLHVEKLNQASQYLLEAEVDLWLILTSEGSDPALPLMTGVATVGPGAFLITKEGKRYAVCSQIDAQDIEESELFDEVYHYSKAFSEVLSSIIRNLQPNKIALNISVEEHLADGLTVGRYRWLMNVLKDVFTGEIVSAEAFLSRLRAIKSGSEIASIREAIRVTEDIYSSVFQQMKPSMTEKQVGAIFIQEMEKRQVLNGIDRTLSMPIVMKENIAHRPPSDSVIQPGDLVIMDFSAFVNGYCSDIARTVYFLKKGETEPPTEVDEAFQAVHGAITAAADAVKPGAQGYEVDQMAREYYQSKGYPEISHATGHQIGRNVHDGGALLGPRWKRYGKAPYETIEEGMVFTIEPTLFLEDNIHFIVEENVVVTKEGMEYLSNRQNELVLIPYRE
ncbi:Xaa-Pro peptidase family protein [Cytobacillus spongiae]|uniref:M24 family metallopeptidase n=1 Tax=Cytobacillus spongiae TaxID=2901381 RepID=UPI001F2ECE3F|nr:Xaa-Pro peptidase family protein [Cytobacillus spongiae]UII57538.1 Xaa-Pro peptidase family protein [Cytobacillus spongiae]